MKKTILLGIVIGIMLTAAFGPGPARAAGRWFELNGRSYQVAPEGCDHAAGKLTYRIETSGGQAVQLPESDRTLLAWAYEMSTTGYLDPARLDSVITFKDSMKMVGSQHRVIDFCAELQDRLMQLGVIGTAAYFGQVPAASKAFSSAVLNELKNSLIDSPNQVAEGWGAAMMAAGQGRLDNLVQFLRNRRQAAIGTSAAAPLNIAEVQQRYRDAAWVDIYLIPAAQLLITTQRDGAWHAQLKDLLGVIVSSAAGQAPAGGSADAIRAMIDAGKIAGALAASHEGFAAYNKAVQKNKEKWERSVPGLGDAPPASFQAEKGSLSGVVAKQDDSNITTDVAGRVLPYARLSLDVYKKTPDNDLISGWQVLADKRRGNKWQVGFHGRAYQNSGGQIVVAFEGTDQTSIADWKNNLGQLVTVPDQYKAGVAFAEKIRKNHSGASLVFTGHSLGGGIAQYAAAKLGQRACIFNPAGLWSPAILDIIKDHKTTGTRISRIVSRGFTVDRRLSIDDKQDVVASLGAQLGKLYTVPTVTGALLQDYLDLHSMEELLEALMAITMGARRDASADYRAIIAIVDSSGSMSSTDPKDLRIKAIQMMVDTLGPETRVGIVDFDSGATVLAPLTRLDAYGGPVRQTLKNKIRRIDSSGSTDIKEGLQRGLSFDIKNNDKTSIVLLTDGKDGGSWQGSAEVVPAGLKVHTIALSDQADRRSLSKLSAATRGIADIAKSAFDLPRIMARLFGQASGETVLLAEEGTIKEGETIAYTVYLEDGLEMVSAQVSWPGSDVDLLMTGPGGRTFSSAEAVKQGYGVEADTYDVIRLKHPKPGRWKLQLIGRDIPDAKGEAFTARVSSQGGKYKTRWKTKTVVPEVGKPFSIDIEAGEAGVQWKRAKLAVQAPSGKTTRKTVSLNRLAAALGGTSGQRVIRLTPDKPGLYRVQATVFGQTDKQHKIMRSFDRTFQVAPRGKGVDYQHQIPPFIRRRPGMLR